MSSYQRAYNFQFSGRDGTTLVLSQTGTRVGLMIDFVIEKTTASESNSATLTITNPSDNTIAAFQKEGIIIFQAGYTDDVATVFQGEKESVNFSMENGTKKLEISLLDATSKFSNIIFQKNYPIGSTNVQIIGDLAAHLVSKVPSIDSINPFLIKNVKTYTRAQVISQNAFTKLKDLLTSIDYQYFVNNGTLTIIEKNGFVKQQQVSVSTKSGLIGSPKPIGENDESSLSKNGVEFKSIFNYNLDVGRLVSLKSNSFDNKVFKIESVTHSGNTFEGEYTSSVRAFEVDGI